MMSSSYLREVRLAQGFEPSEVALIWGVDPAVILEMEAGNWVPTRDQCTLLAQLYGIARRRVLDQFYPVGLSETTNPDRPIQIPRKMYQQLLLISERTGVSVSCLVDKALSDYLTELEK